MMPAMLNELIRSGRPVHRLYLFAWVIFHSADWVLYYSVLTVLTTILGLRMALVWASFPYWKGEEICKANGKTELAEWFRLQRSLILWYRRQLSRLYNWIFTVWTQWMLN